MLIPSERHTPEDLALWAEYEAADMLTVTPPRLIDGAVETIRAFTSSGPCYVGCSWGKDSVVLLDMLARSRVRLPVVWVRMRGRDNPDCEAVRDAMLSRIDIDYHERTFVYEQCQRDEHWRAIDTEFGDRRITGVRASESSTRRMSVGVWGPSTPRSCRPLAYWQQEHVFAWLVRRGLPIHPAYAMLGGGRYERKYLRTHGIGGRSGTDRGRAEWEREYYGDVLARIGRTS